MTKSLSIQIWGPVGMKHYLKVASMLVMALFLISFGVWGFAGVEALKFLFFCLCISTGCALFGLAIIKTFDV